MNCKPPVFPNCGIVSVVYVRNVRLPVFLRFFFIYIPPACFPGLPFIFRTRLVRESTIFCGAHGESARSSRPRAWVAGFGDVSFLFDACTPRERGGGGGDRVKLHTPLFLVIFFI